jgi:hypothetical protein
VAQIFMTQKARVICGSLFIVYTREGLTTLFKWRLHDADDGEHDSGAGVKNRSAEHEYVMKESVAASIEDSARASAQ